MKQTKLVRILHITESHSKADGGVTTVVNDLAYHLNGLGVYSCIIAATDKVEPVPSGVDFVKLGKKCNAISGLFSSALKASIRSLIQEKHINVIHIHGVWMPLQNIASCLAEIKFNLYRHVCAAFDDARDIQMEQFVSWVSICGSDLIDVHKVNPPVISGISNSWRR